MTRSNARELALHLILDVDYTRDPSETVVDTRMDADYYATLQAENEVYADRPSKKQLAYIRDVTAGVQEKEEALRGYISKYAINWNVGRISRMARAILELAIYEILYVEDVPASVAINEAMVLAKKYESEETAGFINGILGAFVRGENRA